MAQDLSKLTETSLNPLQDLGRSPIAGPQPGEALATEPGALTLPTPAGPTLGPNLPTPAPFKVDVPTTINSKVLATAYESPATVPPALLQLQKEQANLAATGFATPELAAEAAKRANAATVTEGKGGASNVPETTPPPTPTGPTGADLGNLFPDQKDLATQYDELRKGDTTLSSQETELAKVNTDLASLQATIDNVESDVRATYGGTLDESSMRAAINDRLRRIAPEYTRLQRRQDALQTNVTNRNNLILQKLGFTQQDVVNRQKSLQDARQNINDMLTTYGSSAFANLDPTALAKIEASAGLPAGFLGRKVATLKEQEAAGKKYEFKEVNGQIFKFEPTTGTLTDTGIKVPQEQNAKDQLMFALEVAKAFPGDPAYAANLIRTLSGQGTTGTTTTGTVTGTGAKKVADLSDEELSNVFAKMANAEGYGKDPNNVPTRLNNPLDLTYGSLTKHWVDEGKATIEAVTSTDKNGKKQTLQFLKFNDPATGLQAGEELIRSAAYSGLSLDAALKKWSGNGYGSEILGEKAAPANLSEIQKGATSGISDKTPDGLLMQAQSVFGNPKMPTKQAAANIASFNSYIEKNDIAGAQKFLDGVAIKTLTNTQQQDFSNSLGSIKSIDSLMKTIDKFAEVNPGLYKTAAERAKPFLNLKKDQKWVSLTSNIEAMQTTLRRALFGTALTDTEKKTADDLLADISKDDIETIKTKFITVSNMMKRSASNLLDVAKGNI